MKAIQVVLFSLFISLGYSQSIKFQRTYGAANYEDSNAFLETNDGGYIIAGTIVGSLGGENLYVVKTDTGGNILWKKIFVGTNNDAPSAIGKTNDGGYIIGGATKSNSAGDWDFLLMKIDSLGTMSWSKTYGGTKIDDGAFVQQTTDGGFAFFGTTYSYGAGSNNFYNNMYLIKTNSAGDTLWTKTYGGSTGNVGRSAQQTDDGGYILSGTTQSFGLGNNVNIFAIKTDVNGNTLWSKHYGGLNIDLAFSIQQTADRGYIIGGSTYSFGAGGIDMYLIKTNSNGDTLWTKTYGGSGDDEARCVRQTNDHGYIITGYSTSFSLGDSNVALIKIDSTGDVIWAKTYGGLSREDGQFIQLTRDNGYAIAGLTTSYGAGNYDIYFIKMDSLGSSNCFYESPVSIAAGNTNTAVTSVTPLISSGGIVGTPIFTLSNAGNATDPCSTAGVNESILNENIFQVFPNPFFTQATFTSDSELRNASLKVYDVFGKEVRSINFSGKQVSIKRESLQSGIYFYQIISDNKISSSGKLVLK